MYGNLGQLAPSRRDYTRQKAVCIRDGFFCLQAPHKWPAISGWNLQCSLNCNQPSIFLTSKAAGGIVASLLFPLRTQKSSCVQPPTPGSRVPSNLAFFKDRNRASCHGRSEPTTVSVTQYH
eukprot:1145582-Pelagomonas_calceolata.AAC.2